MFTNSKSDMEQTLNLMRRRAMDDCRFNQTAAKGKVAEWVSRDRRFDNYDSAAVAREVFSAHDAGRSVQLDKPYQTNSGAGRSV